MCTQWRRGSVTLRTRTYFEVLVISSLHYDVLYSNSSDITMLYTKLNLQGH
jgi:hypothetical protein